MPYAVCHYLESVQGGIKGAERGGFHGTHDIAVKGDQIVYDMQIFIVVILKPCIIVVIIDVGNRKEQFFFPAEMMIESAAGGA